ncbi:MAG: ABC transporter substrate-binding protein, partial [Sphaerobacter thermophilus]
PETTAALARLIPYGPVNKKAFDYLDEELAKRLPSEPELKQSQIVTNFEWWEKNLDEATERFQSWILE